LPPVNLGRKFVMGAVLSIALLAPACPGLFAGHEPGAENQGRVEQESSFPPGCAAGKRTPERLRLGLGGFWGSKASQNAYSTVASFLAARIGMPVDLVPIENYDDLIARLEKGDLEVAKLPPLAYVKARELMPCLRYLRTMVVDGAVYYSGYIIVRRDSPLTSLADLAGRSIAFVERSSASGYLFPVARLLAAGLKPGADFAGSRFLGTHEAVIRAVLDGEVEAGATFQGALKSARMKEIDIGSLRVLGVTGRIPLDAMVARQELAPALVRRITAALDELNNSTPDGRKALGRLHYVNGWVPGDDSFYQPVRRTLEKVRALGKEAP